jgi:hypothetical protein
MPVLKTGQMFFSPAPKLAPASMNNQLVFTAGNDATNGYGTFFQSGKFTASSFTGQDTNKGSYTYAAYSPVAGLFKLTNTNGTEYVIARFAETNYGEYFSVDYDPTNLLTLIDKGHFIIDSQKPGGNAAPGLTNRNLHIYSGGDEFDVQFGDTTYSQESASTNFDNDVGNYTYSLATTNIGQLNLSVLAPPVDASSNVLAGSASAARLLYLASNAGIFTNEDGTFSAFALTSVTNLAPDILTNTTVVFVENDFFGSTATINLADDGTFSYLTNSAGTYDYTRYSPSCGMLRLIESTNGVANNNPGGTDWVQLFFKSANGGTNYGNGSVELIGPTNDLKATISGTFSQH